MMRLLRALYLDCNCLSSSRCKIGANVSRSMLSEQEVVIVMAVSLVVVVDGGDVGGTSNYWGIGRVRLGEGV